MSQESTESDNSGVNPGTLTIEVDTPTEGQLRQIRSLGSVPVKTGFQYGPAELAPGAVLSYEDQKALQERLKNIGDCQRRGAASARLYFID